MIDSLVTILKGNPRQVEEKFLPICQKSGADIKFESIQGMYRGKSITILPDISNTNVELNPNIGVTFRYSGDREITVKLEEEFTSKNGVKSKKRQIQVHAWKWDNNSEVESEVRNVLGIDKAMVVATNGGIDLNGVKDSLKTQNQEGGINFHIDQTMLQQLQNAPGLSIGNIIIQPLNSLPEFLGSNN